MGGSRINLAFIGENMKKDNVIDVGDSVRLVYIEYWEDFDGVVKHIPEVTGDMFCIETDDQVIYINPHCSALVGVFKNIE